MLRKNKFRKTVKCGSGCRFPVTTQSFTSLSSYIAGASDPTGEALKDGAAAMFDDGVGTADDLTSEDAATQVDPWCDPRMSIFDHIAEVGAETVEATTGDVTPDTNVQ